MNENILFETDLIDIYDLKRYESRYKRERDESLDFREFSASAGVFGIHPYPAMFHYKLVEKLLLEYSQVHETVLDPFTGSGVVAVECLLNNRNFLGYDINPLAIKIAEVRLTPISRYSIESALEKLLSKYKTTKPQRVSFNNIEYWFEPDIIKELSRLRKSFRILKDDKLLNFFTIVFSELVRRVSNTDYNEFKLYRKSNGTKNDVISSFKDITNKYIKLIAEIDNINEYNNLNIEIFNKNILNTNGEYSNNIDLVITSPPYGDSRTTVAYGQFSRLSLQWLGFEEKVDRTSLGSKRKQIYKGLPSPMLYEVLRKVSDKDAKRAQEVYAFYDDLFEAMKKIVETLRHGGFVCFVVGNRRVKGIELPTDIICADFFTNLGLEHQKTLIRAISNKRMPSENSPTNIPGEKESTMKYEYIVILQKP